MDVVKRIEAMRLTPKEQEQAFFHLMGKVDPSPESTDIKLISFSEIYEEAKEIADKGNQFSGLSTGFPNTLDKMTLGLNGGDLIVFYGYTSMGKSQLAQNVSLNIAKAGTPVLFIGLELTNRQNAARFIRMGGDDPNLPFIFPEKADIKYQDIQGSISKAKADGVGLVIVDQLQDLIHSTVNEQGEIGQIMAELKRAAITNDVPIIVMSHVNREGSQPGPPPLSSLKGSASIEQKADMCIAVYQEHTAEYGEELYKKMQVRLTKNRQKGMEFQNALLDVNQGMKLSEAGPAVELQRVFPGAAFA